MFAIAQTAWLARGLTSIGWLLGLRHLGHTTQHSTLGRCQQLHGRRSLESILDSVSGFLARWAKGPSQPISRGPGVFPPMVELQGGLWAHRRIPGSHHGRAGVCEDHLFCGLQIIHLITTTMSRLLYAPATQAVPWHGEHHGHPPGRRSTLQGHPRHGCIYQVLQVCPLPRAMAVTQPFEHHQATCQHTSSYHCKGGF